MGKIFVNRWLQALLLFGLLFMFVTFSFSGDRWRQLIRNFTFDNYNIVKPYDEGDDVIIVDIDEKSLAHPSLGQWPWSRVVLADLVRKLDELGASVIAFDMVFPEEDRTSPSRLINLLDRSDMSAEDIRARLLELPDNDQVFGEAITEAGNVVLGFSFAEKDTRKAPRSMAVVKGRNVAEYVLNLKGVTTNLRKVSSGAAGNGSFFTSADADGIIRRVPMLVTYSRHGGTIKGVYPSLSLEAFRVSKNSKEYYVDTIDASYARLHAAKKGIEGVKISKNARRIPTTPNGDFLVYFAEPDPKKWYVSALDVLDGSADPDRVKDKIAIIGTSAVGLKDIRSTPLSPFRPGAEIHLNIIDQILQQKFLYRSIEAEGIEAVSILMVGTLIILLTPFAGVLVLSLAVTSVIAALFYGGWYAFAEHGFLIDVTYPAICIFALFVISTILSYIRMESDRKQVRDAFGHYISPEFMKELTRDPDRLKLGGETRELTVMFTDIRNFTSISEGLTPEELTQLMNDFLTPMSDLVMQNRGTIDKYMGDAMMAFWNAPLDDSDHARHACQTMLKMNGALKPINRMLAEKAKEEGAKPLVLSAGIGLNTGPASVGNMGSKQRFAYSALGDTVNLASRLEGQTKTYGVTNLIGEETYKYVSDLAALEIDLIRVKGKVKPVRVYTLLGDEKWSRNKAYQDWAARHARMIETYRAGDFAQALDALEKCRTLARGNLRAFYDLYEKRLGEFHANPPGADWDGVYVATSK